jgi:glycosyltransferase involved in cell wall biosynthesis
MGQPAAIVQGFRLIGPLWDAAVYRAPMPKVCVASWLVEVGRWYGVPDEQLVHIPMGMDHELFAVRNGLHARDVDVAMLFHPNREKGWSVGRLVLEELARRRPDFRATVFSMAGPPPQPLPRGVELVLDLDQQRLADEVYNATKVLVQASIHEGFGLTAIEAMGCGAALVTTDCGGSRDYAEDGVTASVVPGGDIACLTGAVEALLDDDDRRVALAAAGERSVRKFEWDRSAELLEQFLELYLADPASFQGPPGEDRSKEYTL